MKRTDRRKDRVEVSTHDLVEASTFAEISAEQLMTLPVFCVGLFFFFLDCFPVAFYISDDCSFCSSKKLISP